ncbi:hypothetical protein [Nostoc sp.]
MGTKYEAMYEAIALSSGRSTRSQFLMSAKNQRSFAIQKDFLIT